MGADPAAASIAIGVSYEAVQLGGTLDRSVIAKNLETPDRSAIFLDKSHRESVVLSAVTIGRGFYQPGWRWSTHVGPIVGKPSESHVGLILAAE
jgi:hypothetical protein